MGGYAFTLEEQQTMIALAERGTRAPAIAEQIGRNRVSVSRYLRGRGFKLKHGPNKTDPKIRFEALLSTNRKLGDCWVFAGSKAKRYASFALDGVSRIGAHVASYRLYKGDIPEGKLVRHTCDNKPCVNPEHLVLGTQLDNMADCVERRRIATGEQQGLSVMTEERVRDLRRRHAAGGVTQTALSVEFGISQATTSQIVRRITWKHIP